MPLSENAPFQSFSALLAAAALVGGALVLLQMSLDIVDIDSLPMTSLVESEGEPALMEAVLSEGSALIEVQLAANDQVKIETQRFAPEHQVVTGGEGEADSVPLVQTTLGSRVELSGAEEGVGKAAPAILEETTDPPAAASVKSHPLEYKPKTPRTILADADLPLDLAQGSQDPGRVVLATTQTVEVGKTAEELEPVRDVDAEKIRPKASAPFKKQSAKANDTKPSMVQQGRGEAAATDRAASKPPEAKPSAGETQSPQQKGSSQPFRWKAMSLGSPGETSRVEANGDRSSEQAYHKHVWSSIARHKPRIGRGGSTTVTFAIGTNGMLRSVSVSRSSGDAQLDRLAIASVRKAAPFRKPPSLGNRPYTVRIYFR